MTIDAFFNKIPKTIDAFLNKIPKTIDAFSNKIPKTIDAFFNKIPKAIDAFFNKIPKTIDAFFNKIPKTIDAFFPSWLEFKKSCCNRTLARVFSDVTVHSSDGQPQCNGWILIVSIVTYHFPKICFSKSALHVLGQQTWW